MNLCLMKMLDYEAQQCKKKKKVLECKNCPIKEGCKDFERNKERKKMKTNKKILGIILAIIMVGGLVGCQGATRSLGDSTTIELESNTKLESITWKDDSLWYCTRPMREDEEAETHTYQQSSEFGVFEGTVTIVESKTED